MKSQWDSKDTAAALAAALIVLRAWLRERSKRKGKGGKPPSRSPNPRRRRRRRSKRIRPKSME